MPAWADLAAPELRDLARADAVVLCPVASLEQHGPHLPTATDSLIGDAVCRAASDRTASPSVALPPVWTGLSEHHFPFGGTISLDHAALFAVLRGIARSLRACGFRRLFLVNTHGGNTEAVALAAREIAAEFAMPVVAASPWRIAAAEVARLLDRQGGVQHACEAETSLLLHLAPRLVHAERIAGSLSEGGVAAGEVFARALSFAERAPRTGVRGDPRAATAGKGAAILEALAAGLARAVDDASLWRDPDPVWRAGRGREPL
ncbi:MAG: creatininase family protein [Acetobacteraceae bacterium]|nr:creatininase family protein [Acetobacteraceae bacterium]MDW8397751.1 creatininase family protein [Acetobacteraceae bacterium]